MRIKSLLTFVIILLLIDYSFSGTCYRSESYCAEYGTKQECVDETYWGTCSGVKQVPGKVDSTCYGCYSRTVYDTINVYCTGTRYKECNYYLFSFLGTSYYWYGRHSSCGTENYRYVCGSYLSPRTEYYDCGKRAYSCKVDGMVDEPYTYSCEKTRQKCDWVKDTSNCVKPSIKQ
ncbi:MAG: hypothetical protein PHN19_05995, partial [Patescibacteria group bacterium]|nr:hypothetical protein [Patescibacteria group bacterium]